MKARPYAVTKLFATLVAACTLAGCGLKGDLVMADEAQKPEPAEAAATREPAADAINPQSD